MNGSRPKLQQLFRLATSKKISRIIVEHQDRLTRFNFELLQYFFEVFGVKIEWVSDTLHGSYEAELVKDIISLMFSMSGKVYGKRSAEIRSKDKAKIKSEDEVSNVDSSPNPPETA